MKKAQRWIFTLIIGLIILSVSEAFSQCAPKRPYRKSKKGVVMIPPGPEVTTPEPGIIPDTVVRAVPVKQRRRTKRL